MSNTYRVIVWFGVDSRETEIGTTDNLETARKEARRFLGADAKGVWIQFPNGDYEDVTGREFSPLTVKNRL